MTEKYLPEGTLINKPENKNLISSKDGLIYAMRNKIILEAKAIVCDNEHNLHVSLPSMKGIIPRCEGAVGISEQTVRDVALISRVNKPVCFYVKSIKTDNNGISTAFLSRREVQQDCLDDYINNLKSGQIIRAKVTHLEKFGAFVDVGCGVASMIPIDSISVSRISHSSDRFYNGQNIYAIVKNIEDNRVFLSHKELLGTWSENCRYFQQGETVSGVVRSVESYGIFVELTPNLAGLAEYKPDIHAGQLASVYIKSIIPEKMKIKLVLVDSFDGVEPIDEIKYFFTDYHMSEWIYSPKECCKKIASYF
jgi:small subunit ribosomal protein S1